MGQVILPSLQYVVFVAMVFVVAVVQDFGIRVNAMGGYSWSEFKECSFTSFKH